jgi:hypothetical protein
LVGNVLTHVGSGLVRVSADTNTFPTNLVGNVVGIGSLIPTYLLVGNVVGNVTFPTKTGPIPTKYFVGNKENSCIAILIYFFKK